MHNRAICDPNTPRAQAAFQKYSPNRTQTPPKLLRASFITHLRGSETAPEVLSSAAAAMKHLVSTQASVRGLTSLPVCHVRFTAHLLGTQDRYDKETHDKLTKVHMNHNTHTRGRA